MLEINKIEEESLDELSKEDMHILQCMQDLSVQIEATKQSILGLQKDRESAWEDCQEAEKLEKAARKNFLIKNRPDYKKAHEEYLSFLSRLKVLTTYAENNIKLEKCFVAECEQNITDEADNQAYWRKCKSAHENRVKLYREELARLSQYARRRKEEFEKFELTAEFEIWGKADEEVKLAILAATDAKSVVMSIESQIEADRIVGEELTRKYEEAQAEHEKIFETIKALKMSQ